MLAYWLLVAIQLRSAGWVAWVCAKTGKQKAAAHKSEISVRIKMSSWERTEAVKV
jgi:hypothetical protein